VSQLEASDQRLVALFERQSAAWDKGIADPEIDDLPEE
jgi:hypothetical protein